MLQNNAAARTPAPAARTVNELAQLLSPANIVLELDASSKQRLFEAVGQLFEQNHGLKQAEIAACLTARERLGSTGLGLGTAIPHARIKGLKQPLAAYLRLRMPIEFEAPDGKPVSHIIVLLVPDRANEQHLQLLAWIAQLFADQQFRDQLRACGNGEEAQRLFAEWVPEH